MNPITLDALKILDAIDRKKSFAAAADELYRVPSAISYTVKKLEEDLGVVIFDRSKRKAEFTPAGQLLLKHGRQVLLATDELSQMVIQAEQGWELELRIGLDNILITEPIYRLIQSFIQQCSHVDLRVIEETYGGTWDALQSDRCDLVIGVQEDLLTGDYERLEIGTLDFVFVQYLLNG